MFCFVIPRAAEDLPASEPGDGQVRATRLVPVAENGRAPTLAADGVGVPMVGADGHGAPKVPSPPPGPEVKVQEKHQEH